MYMTMKAEVFKDGQWQKVGNIFKSFIKDDFLTDRVCDERNFVLYEALGGPSIGKSKYGIIPVIKHHRDNNGDYIAYLDDLLAYEWDWQVSKIGVISEFQYKRWKRSGITPINKHRCVFNKNAVVVAPHTMDAILSGETQRGVTKHYVLFEYDKTPINRLCENFCLYCLSKLIEIIPKDGTAHDVRVVYDFIE